MMDGIEYDKKGKKKNYFHDLLRLLTEPGGPVPESHLSVYRRTALYTMLLQHTRSNMM